MKLYAWIDSGTILSTSDESLSPDGSESFEVSHEDQLYINDGVIKVDLTIKNSVETLRESRRLEYEKSSLEGDLLKLFLVKEMDAELGTSFLNRDEFLEKLQQYKNILDS